MSRTKKILIGLLIVALVLVLAVVGVIASISWNVNSQIDRIPSALPSSQPSPSYSDTEAETPINFLVIGSDSRESGGDPTDWEAGAQRSDALMVVQISGDRTQVNVMSIPRDSWVEIPGYGEGKINAAYSYGGSALAVETVQNLTGIPIDHVVITDFASFEQITDLVGGVDISTSSGVQHMNGEEALAFVRERYDLADGDFGRVRRQQAWMKAIVQAVFSEDVLTSPSTVLEMVTTMSEYVAVDEDLSLTEMATLAYSMRDLDSSDMLFLTAPNNGTGTSSDGQSIVVLDDTLMDGLSNAFATDTVRDFVAEHEDELVIMDSSNVN